MGLRGVIKFFFRRFIEIALVLLIILFLPNLPPKAEYSESFRFAQTKPLSGKLALNEKLQNVELWHKGDLFGPEAFADYNGELYTTVHGGDIVKLVGNHITPIVKTGKACQHFHQESICGRPLGFQFDQNGNLFVNDAYFGLLKVNVKTGEKTQIISPNIVIDNKKPKLFNSLAVASNGDIYWTDSSSDFDLENGVFAMLADGSGRLIHYNSKTRQNSVLIDKIHFANGVALSDDEEFVIVAETARNRVLRYYIKGPKMGTKDVFIDGLPGLPDNLKSIGKDGFLIPLVASVDDEHPQITQALSEFPLIRKLISRIFGVIELAFSGVNKVYPNEFSERSIHFIGHFLSINSLFKHKRFTLLRVSKTGEIIESLHTTNGKISGISEAHIFKDHLFLGSPFNDYIGKISLSEIGWQDFSRKVVKREAPTTTTAKPATTTPKPTTTTPKPTTTTPKPTTTTQKPTTTTQKPTTTTPRPTTATPKATTQKPVQKQAPTNPPPTVKPAAPKEQKTIPKTTPNK